MLLRLLAAAGLEPCHYRGFGNNVALSLCYITEKISVWSTIGVSFLRLRKT